MKKDPYFLYRHHNDINSILGAVKSSELPEDFQLKFLFLMSKGDVFEAIKEWMPSKYTYEILEEGKNKLTIRIEKHLNKEGDVLKGVFNIERYENSPIYVVVTHESQKFVKGVILEFFNSNYSNASRLYLTSNQLQLLLETIKNKLDCDIITERVISYSRIDQSKIISPGLKNRKKESDLRWTEESYKSSFQRAAENDQWVDKISFYAQKEDQILFSASLSREGLFKCSKNAKDFYKIVGEELVKIGNKNVSLFSNRSRSENKGKIKPISIQYSSNVFEDVKQNRRLISALSEFPKSSYSVYHGNPYLHLSMVDYIDGSSYDIWVLSSDKIVIVPQIRSTFNSLSRLCEHILKKFQEGNIMELTV